MNSLISTSRPDDAGNWLRYELSLSVRSGVCDAQSGAGSSRDPTVTASWPASSVWWSWGRCCPPTSWLSSSPRPGQRPATSPRPAPPSTWPTSRRWRPTRGPSAATSNRSAESECGWRRNLKCNYAVSRGCGCLFCPVDPALFPGRADGVCGRLAVG